MVFIVVVEVELASILCVKILLEEYVPVNMAAIQTYSSVPVHKCWSIFQGHSIFISPT